MRIIGQHPLQAFEPLRSGSASLRCEDIQYDSAGQGFIRCLVAQYAAVAMNCDDRCIQYELPESRMAGFDFPAFE